ncbi:hypothetical protein [Methanoculleus chikugoensis]|uniref:helix-turn-helix domain-containing protein n=1 Tax=Methanoculleus chikugoensis TaxID=118126 RepID=UPI000AEFD192|nr:helix-turn-helix domain-containing protein [Methanoculleus chikugoensis]
MTAEIVPGLRALGMNEYAASVYSTLVGLQKATARDIHEVSGVPPRGRIYEILNDLTRRGGFIAVEEGSPPPLTTCSTSTWSSTGSKKTTPAPSTRPARR